MKLRFVGLALVALSLLTACDEDTGSMGIYDEADAIITVPTTYSFTSRSLPIDSVLASSSESYLGQVHDPATGVDVRAEFLAQFHTFENYKLPDTTLILSRENGRFVADSIVLRLYFTNYYGDATNPMKVAVYELDTANVVREDSTYYSTIKLESFKNPKRTEPLAEKVFTASDYTLTESERTNSNHYDHVKIYLPVEYGTQILRMVALRPEFFKDSYQFIHHVCPGFYFQLKSGIGTMLHIDVSTMDIYFRYSDKGNEVKGLTRFSATGEVIQSTRILNSGIEAKAPVDESGTPLAASTDTTYVLSPAGIATELELPIDDIYTNHENDSITLARIIMTCYNSETSSVFSAPESLLMVRKSGLYSFFETNSVPNSIDSYLADFESGYNVYTYSDISRLISALYHSKVDVMKRENLTSEQYNTKYPDWNHVVLTPVSSVSNSSGTVISVSPDFSLSSVKLVGGKTPLKMHVIYNQN